MAKRKQKQWDVRDLVAVMFQADLPVIMWGRFGAGKTEFAKQLFRKCGIQPENVAVVIGSMYQPEDIGGMPVRLEEEGVFDYLPPKFVTRLQTPLSALFCDEVNTATAAMQAAMLRVIQERRVGDTVIQARVLAAANPPEISAGGQELAPPLANRFGHVVFRLDAQQRLEGIKSGWAWDMPILPASWVEAVQERRVDVATFLTQRPNLQDADGTTAARPYPPAEPSERTWDFVARFIAAADAVKLPANLKTEGVTAFVGVPAGREFTAWYRARGGKQVMTADQMLREPKAAAKRYEASPPDERTAMMEGFAHAVSQSAPNPVLVLGLFRSLAEVATRGEMTGLLADLRPHLTEEAVRPLAAVVARMEGGN